jgi:hypothetical protein
MMHNVIEKVNIAFTEANCSAIDLITLTEDEVVCIKPHLWMQLREAIQALAAQSAQAQGPYSAPVKELWSVAPKAAAQPAPVQEPVAHTYASTQATMCACCGEHKHTPLRIDKMGGYVCLTCIDKKLGALLGEFGYPAAQPAVPDAIHHTDLSERPQYIEGWNDCRAEMLKGMK